jgi:hypothetical protein
MVGGKYTEVPGIGTMGGGTGITNGGGKGMPIPTLTFTPAKDGATDQVRVIKITPIKARPIFIFFMVGLLLSFFLILFR